jgi:predicted nucleic acid-binding protein
VTFVLDASTTLNWIFDDEHSQFGDRVLGRLLEEPALVPPIWPIEVANGLAVGERRGRISAARLTQAIEDTLNLPISVQETSQDQTMRGVLELSRMHGLTCYDASYLYLAMREGVPLATQDTALRNAASGVGVELIS